MARLYHPFSPSYSSILKSPRINTCPVSIGCTNLKQKKLVIFNSHNYHSNAQYNSFAISHSWVLKSLFDTIVSDITIVVINLRVINFLCWTFLTVRPLTLRNLLNNCPSLKEIHMVGNLIRTVNDSFTVVVHHSVQKMVLPV